MEKETLVMFSGGKDSFLSTLRMISDGYNVTMISYNNGAMLLSENIEKTANRICKMFPDNAKYAGNFSMWGTKMEFMKAYSKSDTSLFSLEYPHILPYQLCCLCCHTAMHVYSIAYCIAHGIKHMTEGARWSQGFIVELPEMIEEYKNLYHKYGVELHVPVIDLVSDKELEMEIAGWGFVPKTEEAQCALGEPIDFPLSKENIDSLLKYYKEKIFPMTEKNIDNLVPYFRVRK